MAVTFIDAGNVGGGGFMMIYMDGEPAFLDYRETAPLAAHRDMFLDEHGEVIENASLIGRIDRLFEPSPRGDDISYLPFDPTARATMFISGVEFRTRSWLSITPNMIITTYDRNDQGERPDTDLHLRLTLFINFE